MNIEELKYPTGKYIKPEAFSKDILNGYISVIEQFPKKLKQEVEHLSDAQLDTPYRPDGWTIRQVVNHCSDSHMNAIVRLKLALTEDTPAVKAYAEALWAVLADSKTMPIAPALMILEGLHIRWTTVLKSMKDEQWQRGYIHPHRGVVVTLEEVTGMYAWHCNHHLTHITNLKKAKGW